MADITWQRTGQLVHKAFEILLPYEDGLPAKEVLVRVEARSNFEMATSSSCTFAWRYAVLVYG